MTVRTWITLSIAILVALSVAIVVRLLAPVPHPPVLARSGEARLTGQLIEACWPQRSGELRCEKGSDAGEEVTIPGEGDLRIVVAYPAQPEEGSIKVTKGRKTVIESDDWEDELDYDLDPGTYELTAEARYPQDAFVRYRFTFAIR